MTASSSSSSPSPSLTSSSSLISLWELYKTRLREFTREPARIIWVYLFPTMMAVVLGWAFRAQPVETVQVDVVRNGLEGRALDALRGYASSANDPELLTLKLRADVLEEAKHRLVTGKTAILVIPQADGSVLYQYDRTRPDAVSARRAVDRILQIAYGRVDPLSVANQYVEEPGTRYIDFVIPGLIGLNAMGGGLWGIGFLLVNFRRNGLLKRFRATPMPRGHFLLAILGARLTFLIPDVAILLSFGHFVYGVPIRGSIWLVGLIMTFGALAFAGIGLLMASRIRTIESVNGLINLVMLPQWFFSGVFFSYERFPPETHPFLQALPLTQIIDSLRLVILEGKGLESIWIGLVVLAAWAVATFTLALKIFKWT